MPNPIDTKNVDTTAGAVYFVVGRGTEGGPSDSYRLSVAGVTDAHWGEMDKVASNSGYSIGSIQVDLGQQGLQALGSTNGSNAGKNEETYVDAIIGQASAYAHKHEIAFPSETGELRRQLLTHGNGQDGRPSISFMDKDTLHSINAWASSDDGKQWIHHNIDYGQVRSITQSAIAMVDKYGKNISDEHRFETICILAKTQNQYPKAMDGFKRVMEQGGSYSDVIEHAHELSSVLKYYDGVKAATLASKYQKAYGDPVKRAPMDRSIAKVGSATYNPAHETSDPDILVALSAIHQSPHARHAADHGILQEGMHGAVVGHLQTQLTRLGYTDSHGNPLKGDNDFGPATKSALQMFQHDHGLTADGRLGPITQQVLAKTIAQIDETAGTPSIATRDIATRDPVQLHRESGARHEVHGDPRHANDPLHGLYMQLHERIPDASEKRLLQFTAACHAGGINPKNIGQIAYDENHGVMYFMPASEPRPPVAVDVKTPSPDPQHSIQQIQQANQLQAHIHAQSQAQGAQIGQ